MTLQKPLGCCAVGKGRLGHEASRKELWERKGQIWSALAAQVGQKLGADDFATWRAAWKGGVTAGRIEDPGRKTSLFQEVNSLSKSFKRMW